MIEVCCRESMNVVFHLRVSNEWTTERMNEYLKNQPKICDHIPTEGESNDWIKMNYGALHISHSKSYYLNELTWKP